MHQCVRCSKLYNDGDGQILKGCTSCNGKFFFYVKKERIEEVQEATSQMSESDKERIERDVLDIIGAEDDKPIILDLESINILKPGKFELDLSRLFRKDPMVYRLEEGKYIIDLAETFKAGREKKKAN